MKTIMVMNIFYCHPDRSDSLYSTRNGVEGSLLLFKKEIPPLLSSPSTVIRFGRNDNKIYIVITSFSFSSAKDSKLEIMSFVFLSKSSI